MSYQLIPNIIFIVCVAGIIIIILRALPDAISDAREKEEHIRVEDKLQDKGLPALAISKVRTSVKLWSKKLLNFILEAKDVAPSGIAGYKIKKMFKGKQPEPTQTVKAAFRQPEEDDQEIRDEAYYLKKIKTNPKNFENYYELGRLYLSQEKYQDAADIFQYLSSHEPTNPEFHSKEALSYYRLKQYEKAIASYEQAIALDKTQPNRYYNLGVSAESAGDHHKAVEAFRQAIALEPDNGKYYISLANALALLDQKAEAVSILRAGRQHDPNNLEIVEKLNGLMK